jgi:hypothetical protein
VDPAPDGAPRAFPRPSQRGCRSVGSPWDRRLVADDDRRARTGTEHRSNTPAVVAARMAACDGYSGCIGVALSGVQPGSRSVASLPSRSPLRTAVTGRQRFVVELRVPNRR